ncbi:hypothetical protein F5Y12DRAFT_798921 [Xylaria sp. FL1777]|nr:hypothetical protein F5Y12DRAFT_798921 [Xylaria sp. FL1777]
MLIGHKKSLRARAKTTLEGFTFDPKLSQDSFNANSRSIAAKVCSKNEPSTTGGRETKNASRSRADLKSLTVDTKLARDTYKAENASVAANTRLARKASYFDPPRLSEAMMNRNWRNPRHPLEESSPDMTEPLWSAPPEQSKGPSQVTTKSRRDDDFEVIDYDHGLKRAAYRCRRPDDVVPDLIPFTKPESISADLCLSAPATKTEFSAAEIGTEERSAKYDPSVFQPSIKSIVRLDEMVPTKRAGYERILNWDEQHVDPKARGRFRDSSSITIVSLADPSECWEAVDFPYAEIRAVKGNTKFGIGLSDVEETIRSQLSTLVEPQSAGLPPNYLRKEYEEMQHERRKAMALAKSTLGTHGRRDGAACNRGASGAEGVNDTQFNDLLGKLNKLCAPRLRAFTVNDKDELEGRSHTNEPEDVMKAGPHSPSGDSGISGLSFGGRQRSSTLNPEASEFRFTTHEKESPTINGCEVTVSGPAASTNFVPTSEQTSGPTDPIRLLETRVAELEAQIARQESKQGQFARSRWAKGYKTNQVPFGAKGCGSMIHGGGIRHPGMNRNLQGPTGYQAAYSPLSCQPPHSFAMEAGRMPPNPVPVIGYGALPQNGAVLPPNGMPSGLLDPSNTTQAMLPFGGHGALVPTKPATGTSLWVKSMFGPKPVSKPDRPFRPGDGVQAVRQQEYEEYLEHLRATDPNYALSCKQRQARRADRQRPGPQHGDGQRQ